MSDAALLSDKWGRLHRLGHIGRTDWSARVDKAGKRQGPWTDEVKVMQRPTNASWFPTRASRSGFTLVEMVVVLLVLMIAAAMTVPSFGQSDDARLRSAARLLAADLDYARIDSITHGEDPRLVVFDTDEHQYHIAAQSDPDTPLTNTTTRQNYLTRFGDGRAAALDRVEIEDHDLDGDNELAFGIYGQLDQNDPATITLAAGQKKLTLTVDPINGEVAIGDLVAR